MLFKNKSKGITEKQVLAALSYVDDPDLKKDLVTLNMIRDIQIDGKKVSFSVVLTTPACPMKDAIHNACVNAIHLMVDKEAEVVINMTAEVQNNQADRQLPNIKHVIAISSGKGGVGKSTVAANVAVALAKTGAKVALVDADIYGPSQPILFGFEQARPMMETVGDRDMLVPFERHGVKVMSIGVLVRPEQAVVWRGPMASKALRQIIFDTNWGEIDYMLIDLPPGTGDIHLTLVQALPVSGAVVITTPQKVAVADARKGAEMFRTPQIQVPLLGVIENMAFFVPSDAPDKRYHLFGKDGGKALAEGLEIPVLGQIPIRESISIRGDEGAPIALLNDDVLAKSFQELAQEIARQLAIRNATLPPTSQVQIQTP
ncbi:Mrp/NBP35 family ATP-binding protein [Pontibacter sp. G13]|uniref:Mrp/NBP35 family ATP-binding protein n=1 Tax=Pontibacter sp. G13 TaxID=3074898 RepID=UPI00288B4B8A|nr:Mrp/NBP35 family ATP-binding protein [Pontibacter sp. G13]WNJ18043.1 Mrp/NBP35 family ATP-binding protein [Pontibacter sp. G13]